MITDRERDAVMRAEFAPAKVNLHLHVTGRRADGYHLLDSLVVFPPVGDELTMAGDDEAALTITGRFAAALTADPDNLILRAARRFGAVMQREARYRFHLVKSLPVASGIGGGSADAAAALRLIARAWACDVPEGLALALGADVPACIASIPARMSGIGEVLEPAPELPPYGMVLVNPGVAVSTPAIFKVREGTFSPPAILPRGWDDAAAMAQDLARLSNDLEAPAIRLQSVIAESLAAIRAQPQCLLARMSGSGATCFGLFPDAAYARQAAARLSREGWWVWGG